MIRTSWLDSAMGACIMRRLARGRGFVVVLLIASCCALASAAVALPGTHAGTPLTQRQLARITSIVQSARLKEELADDESRKAAQGEKHDRDLAEAALRQSRDDLHQAGAMLTGHRGVGEVETDLANAVGHDSTAILRLSKGEFSEAELLVGAADSWKSHALKLLPHLPTASTGPPTSGLADCAFEATPGAIMVKVAWLPGSELSVIFSAAGAIQSKTAIIGSAGTAYIGPFNLTAGTAAITIQGTNPTTGQTTSGSLSTTIDPTTAPATDCTVSGG